MVSECDSDQQQYGSYNIKINQISDFLCQFWFLDDERGFTDFFFKEDPFINITDGSDDKTLRTVTNKQDSIMQSHTSETLTLTHHSKDWSDYTPQMLKSTPSKSLRMKV
ncbi:hypothetical protein MTP99_019765 [Tenebrio molitor]|nr:hypothetical protein MTP99_019765 [Tenebrio molitor]